jgi:hypothetical protein
MQKISTYLYPNRIELLADLAGFTTEYTNVYQRTVKIYNGIDNIIEFDIKNADQKRIETRTGQSPVITQIELNLMDASGNALPNSPYTITPTTLKGIATATIPQEDLDGLQPQFLKYSVTALKDSNDVILYGDSRFGAVGRIELVGDAMPTFKDPIIYDTYTGEIDLNGNVINHFSAMPTKFYEAVATELVDVSVYVTGFIGTIWLQGTRKDTINTEAFKNATRIQSTTLSVATTTTVEFNNIDVSELSYLRVSFQGNNPLTPTGTVDKVELDPL